MAPVAAKKREAPTVPTPCRPKKAGRTLKGQADPVEEKCTLVLKTLQSAGLPPLACELLEKVLPLSLAICQDQRHGFQERMMVATGAALSAREAELQRQVEAAQGKVEAAVTAAQEAKDSVAAAEAGCRAQQEAVAAAKALLVDAAVAFRAAKGELAAAREAQSLGEVERAAAVGSRNTLERAARELFQPLKQGLLEQGAAAEKAAELLRSLEGIVDLAESLAAALPKALATPLAERSAFNNMVMQQLEDFLSKHSAQLQEAIEAGEPARAQCAAASQATQVALETASGAQVEAAAAFTAAREALEAQERDAAAAKQAVRDAGAQLRRLESSLGEAQVELDGFSCGLRAFGELCSRQTPTPEPEAHTAGPEPAAAMQGEESTEGGAA